ncbi:MAG TPA: M14 family zinc carboxypeptidase [Candidatus Polarisedimenticolia bacterium]|nr:M14 family zinc carboxypeptidase [Candidatus Polarisedimenticolia bacterium]
MVMVLSAALAGAQDNPYAPDVPEPGSVEEIRRLTTDLRYLPPAVAYVPESRSVPSPTDHLGRIAGAEGELSDTATVAGYFRALDAASDRVQVRTLGTSEEGREIILAVIADAAVLKNLDAHRADTAALADPRVTGEARMKEIVARARPIYYLNGGLHSPETGSPEMLMELAYRLAVSEQPAIKRIRSQVIVLINPVSEPDGRDRVVQWFYRHQKGKTDYDLADARGLDSPPYWGHYIFHDNNRDGIQITAKLTEAVAGMYWDFHPTVIHDLHESLPLLYIMTGHGPYSEAIDPVTVAEWTQMALHEVGALQAEGLPGVWSWGFWDGWWPGYLFSFANNHNAIGRFYETFGNASAETFRRTMKDIKFVGKEVTTREWYRLWPPDKVLRWSLRNNTNYMQAGVLEALDYAALHREDLLRNFWLKSRRSLEKGRTEAPYGWIFPEEQADRGRLAYLVNQLGRHHIEVHRASGPIRVKDKEHPAGSFVVRMDQPYRNAAYNFLKIQEFPKEEANTPYDDVAWTLPLLYGVEGERVDDPSLLEAPMERVVSPVAYPGRVEGTGPVWLLEDTGQTSLLTARVRLGDADVQAAEEPFASGGAQYPAGSWIVSGGPAVRGRVEAAASELGLHFSSAPAAPGVPKHALNLPRLAVYHTWIATQDAGWVRYTLDQAGMPYTYINDDDVRKGGLRRRFDVILMPDTWGELRDMIHGIDPRLGPLAYTRTDAFPSHGIPDASEDITGGMGFAGMENLRLFLEEGGLFLALGDAGILPIEGGLARDVSRYRSAKLFTPGSELRARFRRPGHPIAYGYSETPGIFRGNGALFDVKEKDAGMVVMQFGTVVPKPYGEEEKPREPGKEEKPEPLCISGLVKGEEDLAGKPAILDIPAGKGRVVVFAFNPLHRFLNHSDFRLAYNVLLNHDDLPPPPAAAR